MSAIRSIISYMTCSPKAMSLLSLQSPCRKQSRADRLSTRSAQIRRMTLMAQDLNEVEIDAANAEVEPRPGDARMTKLVVDLDPGGVAKMHGVRRGLTGTYQQPTSPDATSQSQVKYIALRTAETA